MNINLNNVAKADETQTALDTKTPFYVLSGVSGNVDFATPKIYGNSTTFKTGNITVNTTGAKYGIKQKIYHLDSIEPDFGVNTVLISGAYRVDELNILYYEYAGVNRVEVSIEQVVAEPKIYIRRSDFVAGLLYCGFAIDGSLESENVWTITKITIADNGSATSETLYNVAWTDRTIIF
jgi:hypothetical protein